MTYEKIITVKAPCCSGTSGSSYAWGDKDGSSAATCFKYPVQLCSNSNWGWRNKFSGSADAASEYKIIVGGGNDCKNIGDDHLVGRISAQCTDGATADGDVDALVTLSSPNQFVMAVPAYELVPVTNSPLEQHYYVGCRPPTCSPPSYGAAKGDACSTSGVQRCGGSPSNIPIDGTYIVKATVARCKCADVYWVYHQSVKPGVLFTLPHIDTLKCPAVS